MKPLQLLFIRHAESIGNQQKRMQGHLDDPLSELGRQQAEQLGQRLLIEAGYPTCVYSSPLQRAAQTADILLHQMAAQLSPALVNNPAIDRVEAIEATPQQLSCQISVIYADELREFQNGIFAGLTWTEAQQQYPELCFQLEGSPDWIQIPEAESLQSARERSHRFIQTLLQRHHNGETIWIISHSWILQHLISELLGCDRSWRIPIRNTALFEFWIDRSRWPRSDQTRFNTELWQICRFNDCHHLL